MVIGERRRKILKFVNQYYEEHKVPPTYREIMLAVGLRSTSTVWSHLRKLARSGELSSLGRGRPRSYVPVNVASTSLQSEELDKLQQQLDSFRDLMLEVANPENWNCNVWVGAGCLHVRALTLLQQDGND